MGRKRTRCPAVAPTAAQHKRALGMPTRGKVQQRRARLVAALASTGPVQWRQHRGGAVALYSSPQRAAAAVAALRRAGAHGLARKGCRVAVPLP